MARTSLWRRVILSAAILIIAAPAAAQSRRPKALANIDASDTSTAKHATEPVARVTLEENGQQKSVAGRILIEAADGGLLLQANDGQLYPIDGVSIVDRKSMAAPFLPLDAEEIGRRLLEKMPPGFRIHTTPHYIVCYNTSREYAEWVSSLYERLYKAFTAYWQRKGFELHEPEFPLVVIAYADRSQYEAASREDLGDASRNVVGYYNLLTNYVNMYDLTGTESLGGGEKRRGSTREINQMLSQRAAIPLVATIVHEATHQIAFNCGLQTRLSDIPLWQCEGMATVFEAPDLASSRGWRGIGRVNYARLDTFRRNLPNWQPGALESLISDNRTFRDPRTAVPAYADAWALNYYLIRYRPDEYAAYLKSLAAKPPLSEDTPAERLAEFRKHFGDLKDLEAQFLKQMSRIE